MTLVGKGVCFDSGGLDIKPGSGMALMKKDMGGAAVALGARAHAHERQDTRATARAGACRGKLHRRQCVPARRRAATRKGLTVEVGNTDAEGRLVLCDALALADAERPDLIIDFATLTGAARVALGPELPALFGNDERHGAGTRANRRRRARSPVAHAAVGGYEDELAGKIADLNNVAASTLAGAIFGALFLKRFVSETTRWVHIDLYAWNSKDRPGRSIGAEAQGCGALPSAV